MIVTVLYVVLLSDAWLVGLRSGLDAHAACIGPLEAPAIDSVAEACNDGQPNFRSGLYKFRVCAAGDGFVCEYILLFIPHR